MRKPKNKGINSPQQMIIECLIETPATVLDLVERTGFSASFIRTQISNLDASGRIARVDSRMPYMYHVPDDHPLKLHRERIQRSKLALIGEIETENSIIQLIKSAPKEQWPSISNELKAISEAIEMLNGEGRLIDTLEGIL